MKLLKILLGIGFCLMNFAAISQTAPSKKWDKTFGEKRNDKGYHIIQTADKNLAICASQAKGLGGTLWLLITDEKGNLKHQTLVNSIYLQSFGQIIQTSDKGFAAIGAGNAAEISGSDMALIKTDNRLNVQFTKSAHGDIIDMATSLCETKDGGLVVLGISSPDNTDISNIELIKTDAQANIIWQKRFGRSGIYRASKIIQTSDNGFLIVGSSSLNFLDLEQALIIKTDARGNTEWEMKQGGQAADQLTDVVETADGNFLLVGNTLSKGHGWLDAWVLHISPGGDMLWDKTYGGSANDEANAIIRDGEDFIIAGSTKSKGAGDWDAWIFKIDSKGNLIWDAAFGEAEEECGQSVTKTFDGGLALTGTTTSKGKGRKDVWLLKLNFSVRDRATAYVQSRINEWQTKGKFEKLTDYEDRVNQHTRQQKIVVLTNEFYNEIGLPIFLKDIKTATLDYDTESEVFRINMKYFNSLYVPVPINEAESFDKHFKNLKFSKTTFNLSPNDKLEIATMMIDNPVNKKIYFFDAAKPIVFNDEVVVQRFDPIEILPDPNDKTEKDDSGTADTDSDIPDNEKSYTNRYALIIGNSKYIEHGSDMVDIKYADNDANIFRRYAVKVLGVPDKSDHIYYIEDANTTYTQRYIDNFSKLIQNQPDGSEFYVYYSGHGTHDETGEAYIVPVGVTSDYIKQFGIKLSEFYEKIQPKGDKKVIVFVDACFSGGGKSGQLLVNAKTGIRRSSETKVSDANMLVFAASSEKQISQEYFEKQHGLFTYFLLKNLKESKGDLNYGQLTDAVINQVISTTLNPENKFNEQTPLINVSQSAKEKWRTWRVNP